MALWARIPEGFQPRDSLRSRPWPVRPMADVECEIDKYTLREEREIGARRARRHLDIE